MDFFGQRYREHRRIYTHAKTQCFSYMICDIFLLAEQHYRLKIKKLNKELGSYERMQHPISRAMMYADTYLKLTDGILDKIDDSDQDELIPAQLLLDRFNNHNKYVVIDAQIINDEELWTEKLGNMSENEITDEILNISAMGMSDFEGDALVADDIIVKKSQIHHGMKGDNRKWNFNELIFPA